MQRSNEEKSNRWLWRFVIILLLIVAGLGTLAMSKEIYRKRQIQTEIDTLKQEADRIRKENSNLEDQINYLSSQDYQKQEAKDKLNLQSPGENLVIIKPGISKKEEPRDLTQSAAPQISQEKKLTNPQKWWNFFFQ